MNKSSSIYWFLQEKYVLLQQLILQKTELFSWQAAGLEQGSLSIFFFFFLWTKEPIILLFTNTCVKPGMHPV